MIRLLGSSASPGLDAENVLAPVVAETDQHRTGAAGADTASVGRRYGGPIYGAAIRRLRSSSNVAVDHVVFDSVAADDLSTRWRGLDVQAVRVDCRRDVVERRERDRKDRMLGQPGALYDVVHAHLRDDLVVDTSAADPAGCAAQIVHAAGR